jgi:DNA-binding CsgD family transcriptional regulator
VIAALEAMNGIGRAAVPAAIAESSSRYAAAFAGFDPIALRCHAEILAFCAVIEGRYGDVDRILDEILSLGHPSPRAPFAQLGLTVMAGVAASLRGQRESAQQRLDDAERLVTPDGSFPARVRGWADVAAQASQGHADEAADAAARTGDRLWERGARFAAAAVYLTGLELVPDAGELDRVADRVRSIEGELIAAQFAHVRALVTRDPQAMSEAAAVLWDQKRFGMALAAYSAAADGFAGRDDEESAARVSERRDRLENELPPGAYDAVRFEHRFEQLSARELQISRLVAAGRSNREIADELFLSVRTVETHLLRVMRKARVATRHQLGGFLERIGHPAS